MGICDVGVELAAAFKPVARELMAVGERNRWVPSEHSPMFAECERPGTVWRQTTSSVRAPSEIFKHATFVRCFALADYLAGICKIAVHGSHRGDEVVLSAAPIARAALEASAYLYWYCQAEVAPDERIRRMCTDLAHQMSTRHKLDSYAEQEGFTLDPGWKDFAEMLDAWRVPYESSIVPRVFIVDDEGRQQKRPPAQEIMAPLMRSERHATVGAFYYADVSDVAHASIEGLLRRAQVSISDEGTNTHYEFSRDRQLTAIAPLYWGLHRPMESVVSYMGWSHDKLTELYEQGIKRLSRLMDQAAEISDA